APVLAADWKWDAALGGDVRWFDWREEDNGEQLLRETGPLFAGEGLLRVENGAFYSSFGLNLGGGLARYDGRLQSGVPYEADAWEAISDAEWQLGLQEGSGNIHVGLMNRFWHRLIEGRGNVSSAEESYNWVLATVGGGLRLHQGREWSTGLSLDVGVPVSSRQKVYSAEYGDFSLEPGDGLFWRLALPMRSGNLMLRPYYQQQDMDESESVMRQARSNGQYYLLHQPASVRREFGLGVLWFFGASEAKAPEPDPEKTLRW
ncbi:MAG TPA: hypothetical protein VF050_01355, partial [Moraxellaceae bacterium]